jgi:hypothetical protein
MTTPREHYADLLPEPVDPALRRLVGALDQALQAVPAPPQVATAIQRAAQRRSGATPSPDRAHPSAGGLSRKDALKAGVAAAGAAWLLALGHTSPAHAAEVARLAQEGPMTAARLAEILREERACWHAVLAAVGPQRLDVPGVEGTWSVKQIVAHLTWYEGVIVEGAQQLLRTGTFVREGLRALSLDERNAILAEESRPRPAPAILAESERVFGQLLAVIAACPDELLNDPRRLGLPEDVVPWLLVANNSYGHYQEHAQAIRAWLGTQPAVADGGPGDAVAAPERRG